MNNHPRRDRRTDAPIADQLRAARHAAGLSQRGAAAKTGISRRTIEDWETGRRVPTRASVVGYLALLREKPGQ